MSALLLPTNPVDTDVFALIAEAIEQHGYALVDNALPPALSESLFRRLRALPDDALSPAGIGRDDVYQLNRFVRRDETWWLDADDPSLQPFFAWMEQLRLAVNRRLFLGLFDYEAHFARYPAGAFYRKHLDAFGGASGNRVLSTVLYLNPDWAVEDGGEMLLYDADDRQLERIQPLMGRLAVFLSARFPHEVLAPRRARLSIAGWFRINGSVFGQIDPPR